MSTDLSLPVAGRGSDAGAGTTIKYHDDRQTGVSIHTTCAVCEAAVADRTCSYCGQTVCEAHFDAERGRCTDCLDGATGVGDLGPGDLPR